MYVHCKLARAYFTLPESYKKILKFKSNSNCKKLPVPYDSALHCGKNWWIFREGTDPKVPVTSVTNFAMIDNWTKKFSYIHIWEYFFARNLVWSSRKIRQYLPQCGTHTVRLLQNSSASNKILKNVLQEGCNIIS